MIIFLTYQAINISFVLIILQAPGGRINIKMSSYQYMDHHIKDKTVWRPSSIFNTGILIPGKDGIYMETRDSFLPASSALSKTQQVGVLWGWILLNLPVREVTKKKTKFGLHP